MRVTVVLTIGRGTEIRLEGEAPFIDRIVSDELEQKGLGIWLGKWRYSGIEDKDWHSSRVFIPWSSVLYVEASSEERCTHCGRELVVLQHLDYINSSQGKLCLQCLTNNGSL